MTQDRFDWWNNLRHGGLLLDRQRLTELVPDDPPRLDPFRQDRLRRRLSTFYNDPQAERGKFVAEVLESVCGFRSPDGAWKRGSQIPADWSRRMLTGESVRPRHLWLGRNGAVLPVFVDSHTRIGIGRGRRLISQILNWLRQSGRQLALVTNGYQWRLVFAGLDYEAFCEWDTDQWFLEGEPSPELNGFRALIAPPLWTPKSQGEASPLLAAVNESRKGQADLSQVLGERVRKAVEKLIHGHGLVLNERREELAPEEIYRAAVRVIMRMVVVLFAESREGLLPRDNPVYHGAYSLQGFREQLERTGAHKLAETFAAWPRVLALFRLIHNGCSHEALSVPSYGGELFAPGRPDHGDGTARALAVFENACFEHDLMSDLQVRDILDLLTRTKMRIR